MKFYCLSPYSVPENPCLFPILRKCWEGHEFVERIEYADCVLLDLHVRHTDYLQSDVDWLLGNNGVKVAVFCEYDRGNMSDAIYPLPLTEQQRLIFNRIDREEIKSVHFCRLLDKNKTYPYTIFPYEKPIAYDEGLLTPEQLFDRPYDVCMIANTAPSREAIAEAFRKDGRLKCIISIGQPKIDFQDFAKEHKKAKMFVSSAGGGFSNERKQCLFSVSTCIEQRTDQLLLHELTHLDNCLMIDSPPTQQDLDTIWEVVNNKEKLYSIYKSNYDFMHRYYSENYIANDILNKILKHLN